MFGSGFLQDVHIWKNKVPVQNPLLCEEDGPVYQLRRWYEQFYVDQADIAPEMVDRFEFEVDTTKANEYWQEEVAENLAQEGARTPRPTSPRPRRTPDGLLRPHQRRHDRGPAPLHRGPAGRGRVPGLPGAGGREEEQRAPHLDPVDRRGAPPLPGARRAVPARATSRTAARGCCPASRLPYATARSRSEPRTVTDHMSDDVLRAEGRGRGRGDRRRALHLLRGPRRRRGAVRLQAGAVPDPGRAERPDRRRRALLLAVQQPGRRRPAHDHREAHRRGLRVELGLRQPARGRHDAGAAAERHLHARRR